MDVLCVLETVCHGVPCERRTPAMNLTVARGVELEHDWSA